MLMVNKILIILMIIYLTKKNKLDVLIIILII